MNWYLCHMKLQRRANRKHLFCSKVFKECVLCIQCTICYLFDKQIRNIGQEGFQNCEPGTFCSRLTNLRVIEMFESRILSREFCMCTHFYILLRQDIVSQVSKSQIQCVKPRPCFIIVNQNNAGNMILRYIV